MKQLPRTAELEQRLKASFGADAQIEKLAVFEATAANLLPLRKRSGMYQNARFTESLLQDMAASVNKESVPLQAQHDTSMLPLGRVFYGAVSGEELRVWFALNTETQGAVISDLNAGIFDQVSVGILSQKAMCSECGFDFMGEQASFDNWWSLTCDQGHKIGVNGVHVRLSGLSSWFETSIVGKGAVVGAKVPGPSDAVLSEDAHYRKLAASVQVPSMHLVCVAVTEQKAEEIKVTQATQSGTQVAVDLNKMVADLTAAQVEAAKKDARIAELEAQVGQLTTKLEAAASNVDPAEHTAAVTALQEICKRSMIALGEQEPKVPTAVAELVAAITDRQAKLSAVIPVGPTAQGADKDAKKGVAMTADSFSAFRRAG